MIIKRKKVTRSSDNGYSKSTQESRKSPGFYSSRSTYVSEKMYREVVPPDIAEEGKNSGVIQKDKDGNWRIISYKKANKSGKPEFWDAHYETKEDAEKALSAYHANRGK